MISRGWRVRAPWTLRPRLTRGSLSNAGFRFWKRRCRFPFLHGHITIAKAPEYGAHYPLIWVKVCYIVASWQGINLFNSLLSKSRNQMLIMLIIISHSSCRAPFRRLWKFGGGRSCNSHQFPRVDALGAKLTPENCCIFLPGNDIL